MTWFTWRQTRVQLATVYALVVAASVTLAVTGHRLAHLASTTTNFYDLLTGRDRFQFYAGIYVLATAPALIGAFWGAPLVARELESGTYRVAWTQSVTRTRWLATKLGITALATAVAVGALSLAVTWWAKPLDGSQSDRHGS